jgi:hypothetical protein
MPWRSDPTAARVVQVSFMARPQDVEGWRREAVRLRCSLSRNLWLRCVRSQGTASEEVQQVAAMLPRIAQNLNAVARRLAMEGATVGAVSEAMQVVQALQQRLAALC